MKTEPIICIMGPTASGKSSLAMQLSAYLPIEIVSVDSALVYRGFDIGTAKPSKKDLASVVHHLIDICEPNQIYSAGDFCRDAIKIIDDISMRGKLPILTGGTMMYFNLLQHGVATLPKADKKVRQQINDEALQLGWPVMHKKLADIDSEAAARIKPQDQQRIQRALEVYRLTGKTISQLQQQSKHLSHHQFLNIAITPASRKLLHQRIAERFDQMLTNGLVNEVKQLFEREDLNLQLPAMRSVGYRQVWEYLATQGDYEEMRLKAIAATRQLAKRQLTWLRRWPDLHCFDSDDSQLLAKILKLIAEKRS